MKNRIFFFAYSILFYANTQRSTASIDAKLNVQKKNIAEKINKHEYIIKPNKNCQYYQLLLFDFLYTHTNLDHLAQVKIYPIISRKSHSWNLYEAAAVAMHALSEKKYKKYLIFALERLYVLSADARLSELVLWNLASAYETRENFKLACELFSQFKKIFPGSEFYWLSRYKEIAIAYKLAKEDFLDISHNENIIQLIKEYIVDKTVLEEESFNDIILILHDLSFKMIKKHIHIGQHYIKKYSYTKNNNTILSAWQRLDTILKDITFFLDICSFEENHYKKNNLYYGILIEMQKIIHTFFEKQDTPLPYGQEYILLYQDSMKYIDHHKDTLLNSLDLVFYKLLLTIEIYYEKK